MMPTPLCRAGLRALVSLAAVAAAGLSAPEQAQAYGAHGYYTGAEADPGLGGCTGSDWQGYGTGCAADVPANDGHVFSSAHVVAVAGNHGSATASLAAGTLDALAFYPNGSPNNDPRSFANFTDTFTLSGPMAGTATVTARLLLDFGASGRADAWGYQIAAYLTASPYNAFSVATSYSRLPGCSDGSIAQDLCSTGLGTGQHLLSLSFDVGASHPTFRIDTLLRVDAADNESTWGHASLSFTLPAGTSLSSASGVFASAVPEPGSLALWSCGLALVGGLRARAARRRPGSSASTAQPSVA